MSENLKDILSNLNPDIDQETLLRYLQGKMSDQEKHELEKRMIDSDFNADALEGLESIGDKKNITALVHQLNQDLRKRTAKKKSLRKKELRIDPNLLIAIVIILILTVIAFIVVQMKLRN